VHKIVDMAKKVTCIIVWSLQHSWWTRDDDGFSLHGIHQQGQCEHLQLAGIPDLNTVSVYCKACSFGTSHCVGGLHGNEGCNGLHSIPGGACDDDDGLSLHGRRNGELASRTAPSAVHVRGPYLERVVALERAYITSGGSYYRSQLAGNNGVRLQRQMGETQPRPPHCIWKLDDMWNIQEGIPESLLRGEHCVWLLRWDGLWPKGEEDDEIAFKSPWNH
jgi:hypothetical protein